MENLTATALTARHAAFVTAYIAAGFNAAKAYCVTYRRCGEG